MTAPIMIDGQQSATWAQESTLRQLSQLTSNTNTILASIAKARNVQIDPDAIKDLGRSAGGAITPVKSFGKAADEGGKKFSSAIDDLKGTMQTLEWRTRSYSDTISNALRGSSDPMKRLPEMFTKVGSGMGALAGRIPGLGAALTILGASAGALVSMYMESADSYRSMMQSGVLFDGSISGMIKSVRSSGVSMQAATQLIQNRSQALLIGGEQQFFSTVGSMSSTFARFGMTMDQGAETLAELMDQQRITGSLFTMSQQEIIQANTTQLNQMQAISRLTGVSIRQQMEERRRISERQSMRAMAAQLQGPELARFEAMRNALTSAGVQEDAAAGILLQQFGKGATRAGAMGEQALGPQGMAIIRQAMETGDASLIQRNAAVFEQASREMLDRLPAIVGEMGGRGAELQAMALAILERARPAALGATAEQRQAEAARIAAGGAVTQPGTQAYFETVNNTQIAMGRLQSTVVDYVEGPMNLLFQGTERLTAAFADVITTLQQQGVIAAARRMGEYGIAGGQQLLSLAAENPLATGAAAGGVAAAYAANRALAARAAAAAPAAPPVPGGAPDRPGALSRAGGFLRRAGGQVLGFEQLFSAGQAAYQGNFTEAAGHAGLFLLRRNPLAMAASALDFLMEETTGRGLVERGTAMLTGPGAATPPVESPLSSPIVQERQLVEARTINDVVVSLEAGFTRMGNILEMVNSKFLEGGVIHRELSSIASNTNDTRNILNDRM